MNSQRWEDLKSAVLEQVDVESWAKDNLDGVKLADHNEVQALCIFHDETQPSLYINRDRRVFKCHGCGQKGNIIDLYMQVNDVPFRDALLDLARDLGIDAAKPAPSRKPQTEAAPVVAARPPISKEKVQAWHQALRKSQPRVKYLITERGFQKRTLSEHSIGWDGSRYTLPVYDGAGEIVNVRRYRPGGAVAKMIHFKQQVGNERYSYGKPARLYGLDQLVTSDPTARVHVCEGEWDRLLLCQAGWVAVTTTHGVNCWLEGWNKHFAGRDVAIIYDTDSAGRKGAKAAARQIATTAKSVRVVELPLKVDGCKDITDWFVAEHRTADELERVILGSRVTQCAEGQADESDLDFEVHGIVAYKSVPSKYVLDITPTGRPRAEMEINGDTLLCPTRFKRAFVAYFQRVPLGMPGSIKQWDQIVNQWLDRASFVEMPAEASELAGLRLGIKGCLRDLPVTRELDEFDRGRPVLVNGSSRPLINGEALWKHICQILGTEIKRHTFFASLRRLGCTPEQTRVNGAKLRAWSVPGELCGQAPDAAESLN